MRIAFALFALSISLRADGLRDRLAPLAKTLTDQGEHVSFIVGILKDGKTHIYSFGEVTTPKGKVQPDENTLFEIGSITKTFTGILLAEGLLRKELNLDDAAQKYLPQELQLPVRDGKPMTLASIATHRSGLPAVPLAVSLFPKDFKNPYAHYDLKMLAKDLPQMKPQPFGEMEQYSNLGAGLAGLACVNAAKARSYDRLVRDRIAEPTKMWDTAEALNGEQLSRMARGHDEKGKTAANWDFACLQAAGALKSSAADMLRYAAANLDPKNMAMMESHKPRADLDDKLKIGLFWIIEPDGVIWHNGGTGGFRSLLIIDPKSESGMVVLCAACPKEFDPITRKMFEIVRKK